MGLLGFRVLGLLGFGVSGFRVFGFSGVGFSGFRDVGFRTESKPGWNLNSPFSGSVLPSFLDSPKLQLFVCVCVCFWGIEPAGWCFLS